ncbi:ThiF family adenylyltransferase [Alteromonas sp. 1_MG-2023]|uniref:ThiF family adenylyltransferase n=1 Tax=Alteromonas sp. 1_MG-2023 TaxID=3062669 RepID=UPI0034A4E140
MFDYDSAISRNIGWLTDVEQQILKNKKVAIAGMGGVGGEHFITLLRLGVSRFSVSDFDEFEIHNFNRQAGAFISTIDKPKCSTMVNIGLDINPEADITSFEDGVNEGNVDRFLEDVDIYVDSLDFFALRARKLLFKKCEEKGIPVITAAPMGMGTAILCFLPGGMTFEEYFRFEDADTEDEQYVKFLIGLSPSMLQRSYLVDPTKADFKAKKGPSTITAVKLCAGFAETYVLKLLLNRGKVPCAPNGIHFDAYTNKLKKTWRPMGNRNPIQKLMFNVAKSIVLKEKEPLPAALPLSPIEKVLDTARWAPSGDNTQVWRFDIQSETSCAVYGTDTRDWVVYDLDGSASQMALGGLIENIKLAAGNIGYQADVSYEPTTDHKSRYKFLITLSELNAVQPKFDKELHAHIKRRTVQRKPMGTLSLSNIEKGKLEKALPTGYSIIWKESFEDKFSMAKLLYGNGKTRLSMKEGFDVHSKIIEFTPKSQDSSKEQLSNNELSKDKLPAKSLGVDPLTVALTKWSLSNWPRLEFMGKYLGGTVVPRFLMDFVPALKSSAIFAIVADEEPTSEQDFFSAGRAVQRFWLESSVLNLGFQPCQTPVIFSNYLRNNVTFTDNRITIKNADKMDENYKNIFGDEISKKIVFMGRLGRSEVPEFRSVRYSLDELSITKPE